MKVCSFTRRVYDQYSVCTISLQHCQKKNKKLVFNSPLKKKQVFNSN